MPEKTSRRSAECNRQPYPIGTFELVDEALSSTSASARNRVDKAGRAACLHPQQISSTPHMQPFAFLAQSRKSFGWRCLCPSCRSPETHAHEPYLSVDTVELRGPVFFSPPKSRAGSAI